MFDIDNYNYYERITIENPTTNSETLREFKKPAVHSALPLCSFEPCYCNDVTAGGRKFLIGLIFLYFSIDF